MSEEGEIERLRKQLKDLKTQNDAELLLKDAEIRSKDDEMRSKDAEMRSKDAEMRSKDAEMRSKDAEIRSKDAELEYFKAQLVTPRLSESRVDLSAEVTEAAQDSTTTSTNLGSNFSHESFF
jgi:hypothetical protein